MPNPTPNPPEDVEGFIERTFEQNFARLRIESGHGLSSDLKKAAYRQVLLYWRRLHAEVAEKVTDTEVKLNLPGLTSLAGRPFGIDGVADIVSELGCTTMYDIKTHDPDYVRAHPDEYEQQLNVYAHIWRNLQRQPLDKAGIITTQFPEQVEQALNSNDEAELQRAFEQWQPVIEIAFDTTRIGRTLDDFRKIVDDIEEGRFGPLPTSRLHEVEAKGQTFGTRVCRNCDGRFACRSFREYTKTTKTYSRARSRALFGDWADEEEMEQRLDAALEATAPADEIVNNA